MEFHHANASDTLAVGAHDKVPVVYVDVVGATIIGPTQLDKLVQEIARALRRL